MRHCWLIVQNDKGKKHIFWKLLKTKSHSDNPLGGNTKFVLASIGVAHQAENQETWGPLFLDPNKKEINDLRVVSATTETIQKALSLLMLDPAPESVPSVQEGFATYIKTLGEMGIPNKPLEVLLSFVKDRDWVGPFWKGQEKDIFLKEVEEENDSEEKWRLLRRFITFNLAW